MLKQIKSQLKLHLLHPLQRYFDYWLDVISTEYSFRWRRKFIQEKLKKLSKLPRCLYIEGTNVCNAKCTFCAYPQMERPKQTMPMEQFKRIIDEYIEMGGKYVSLTPIVGDPFVDPQIFQRLDYLYQKPQIEGFYFYTNAILMKPLVSEKLMRYGDKLHIYVSWGGFDRETYKAIMGVDYFERACRNVEAFITTKRDKNSPIGFTIALRCPTTKCTGEFWQKLRTYEQEGLLDFEGHNLQYDSWTGKVKPENLTKVGLEARLMPHKLGACELLYAKPVVLANGKVNACACRDVEAQLVIGDSNESSLAEIWSGKEIEKLIERHEKGDFPEVCQHCTWYVSVYNQRQSQVFTDLLNWSEQESANSLRLY